MHTTTRLGMALAFILMWTACGGGGTSQVEEPPGPLFLLSWSGTVSAIQDGNRDPTSYMGIAVGDTMTATFQYDVTQFGAGNDYQSTGWEWPMPGGGLMMDFVFTSGGMISRTVREVILQHNVDRFHLEGSADPVFTVEDPTDASLTDPLPSSFEEAHALFFAAKANFTEVSTEVYFGNDDLWIVVSNPTWNVLEVD